MTTDLKALEKQLAKHKVYDAWQYVESLNETLEYMTTSFNVVNAVYSHRKNTLQSSEEVLMQCAVKTGSASYDTSEINRTNLTIADFVIDDLLFLKKTTMEFFHYARISMDVLFQITNTALLGDDSYNADDKGLLGKLLKKLIQKSEFSTLLGLMDSNKNNTLYKYLVAFDNYIKHIKTIPIPIKNSFLLGNTHTFLLNDFYYDGKHFSSEDALVKIGELNTYVLQTIDTILGELLRQIPNCFNNTQRIQEIKYKQVFEKIEQDNKLQYMSFFIEVESELTELTQKTQEIKVLPLRIKPNDTIYHFNFKFDTIFIRKANSDEDCIIGIAQAKNDLSTNEFYRTFTVTPCDSHEYNQYIDTFQSTYSNISGDYHAMEGNTFFL